MPFYLGVDAGASKTDALIADRQGVILGAGQSGMGNHQLSRDEAERNIRAAVDQALSSAGLRPEQVSRACFGLAGADREADFRILTPMIESLGFARYRIVCDTMIALRAGTDQPYGVVLICGTGTNGAGRSPEGKEAQIGGFGYMYGDDGGGAELAIKAFRAVIRSWEERDPATALTAKMLSSFSYPDVGTMFNDFLDRNATSVPLSIVPELFEAAAEGDPVAIAILRHQGEELGKKAQAIIRRLRMQSLEFDVVLAGSVVVKGIGSHVIDPIESAVRAAAPLARVKRLAIEPVIGAIMSAMDEDGIAIPSEVDRKLREAKPV